MCMSQRIDRFWIFSLKCLYGLLLIYTWEHIPIHDRHCNLFSYFLRDLELSFLYYRPWPLCSWRPHTELNRMEWPQRRALFTICFYEYTCGACTIPQIACRHTLYCISRQLIYLYFDSRGKKIKHEFQKCSSHPRFLPRRRSSTAVL